MKLAFLNAVAKKFSTYQTLFFVRRVGDNLFALSLDFDDFYLDVTRGKSTIFVSEEKICGNIYQAPFDLALNRYCSRAKLLSCKIDGFNRILIFEFLSSRGYKQEHCFLYFEFTGRHTNVILVHQGKILEALRHIGQGKSIRIIRPQKTFLPLPQPKNPYSLELSEGENLEQMLLAYAKEKHLAEFYQKKQVILLRKEKKLEFLNERLLQLPDLAFLQEQAQKFALWGELIFSSRLSYFTHSFCLNDYEGNEVQITLPQKIRSFAEGGNFCFTQSKKYKQKSKYLQIQKEYLHSKIDFLQKEIAYIQSIQRIRDLQVFYTKPPKREKEEKKNYESFFIEGIKVSVGRNMKENQKLLEDAKADDLWLHLKNIPSSHMIIHCGKTKVREEILIQSAKILLGVNGILDKNIAIDYTKRRFVRIIEGANVVYSQQHTLRL